MDGARHVHQRITKITHLFISSTINVYRRICMYVPHKRVRQQYLHVYINELLHFVKAGIKL
jgi:hypothetical protein